MMLENDDDRANDLVYAMVPACGGRAVLCFVRVVLTL
jgi:hypothetical protein